MRGLLLSLFLSTCFWVHAQNDIIILKGQVTDLNTGDGVPFVNIRLNDYYYGTSTNADGRFELKLKTDRFNFKNELRISCIGYHSLVLSLAKVDPNQYQQIKLKPRQNQLDDFVVKSARAQRRENNQAKTLVMDAIDRIPSNKAKSHYLAKTFYRHYCKEDTSYVRLTEAAIDVYQYKKGAKFVQIPENRLQFDLTQMRRSFDFTSFAKLKHPPISLNFLWSNDLTNYEFRNPIRRSLEFYQFTISDTTVLDDDPIAVVEFEPKSEGRRLTYAGKLFINLSNKAFVRADVNETQVYSSGIDSIRSSVKKRVFFQQIGKKYFPQRLISDVNAVHYSLETNESVVHESHVELMVNEVIPKGKALISMGEPTEEDLRQITYDSSFWKQYTVLQATPLEEKIISDLSERISLDKQFEAVNRLKEGVNAIVNSDGFRDMLETIEEKPLYTIIWAKWSVPNLYEVIPSPYMRRMLKRNRFKLLMISLDEIEADWLNNRELYGFDKDYILHRRLPMGFGDDMTRKFFKELMPDFLVIGPKGKVVDHAPPLPNEIDVKEYYNRMLKAISVESSSK